MAHCIIYARFFHPLAFSPLILIFSLIYEIILRVISLDVERATENVKRFDDYVEQHNVYLKLSYDYLTAIEKSEIENQQKEGEKP